jgi:hypothetical protein
MRPSDDLPIDPDIAAELEAIDATLRGRLVDPEFSELAELTVLVAAERPRLIAERAEALDRRVGSRLAPSPPASQSRGRRRFGSLPQWGAGLVGLAAACLAVVVVVHSGGASNSFNPPALRGAHGSAGSAGSSAKPLAGFRALRPVPRNQGAATKAAPSSGLYGSASSPSVNGAYGAAPVPPSPTPTARKTIQSAELQLSAQSRWVDVVAQEVFNVVGQEKGIVRNSQVTAATGNGGSATFSLSIPSANLAGTVGRLSGLRHSHVVSRTDGTQDVNGQYLSDQRRLGDARALRLSLLKQLAAAATQAQITSLKAQLHSAEASISSDESTLRHLQNQISFSQLNVTINNGQIVEPLASGAKSSGGFTIGRAAHDAGRVLTVAAGVALIALAALVPVALLAALVAWVVLWLRRRRREQALDAT